MRIPVIANGDIDSAEKAALVLRQTGGDAVMIRRAAQGGRGCWVRSHISWTLVKACRNPHWKIRAILLGHLRALHAFYGENMGVRIARQPLGWYAEDRTEN